MATRIHTLQITDNFANVNTWNVRGDEEQMRHLGVVLDDAVRGKDLANAIIGEWVARGLMVYEAWDFERIVIGYRTGLHPPEMTECHFCGIACPVCEEDEDHTPPSCGDCDSARRRRARDRRQVAC